MIPCPVCQGPTGVSETRSLDKYVRRRRQCTSIACGARVTTIELVVPDHAHLVDPVPVPRAFVEQVAEGARRVLEGSTLPGKSR